MERALNKRSRNLTEGGVDGTLMKMAGGMIFGFFAMSAFNAVDTYFVGRLGALNLAAMSFTFPVVMIIGSISMGIGLGLSSTVSRAIGGGRQHEVKRLATDGLLLAVLVVLIFTVVGLLTIRPLFYMLGARGDVLDLIEGYMRIWYIGMPFVVIPMAGNNVIRAFGDTLMPSLIMIVAVIVNVILDPLLIFGIGMFPEMGMSGAALATVISRFTTLLFSLGILAFREKVLTVEIPTLSTLMGNWKRIAFIGVPAALVQAITPLTLGILTGLLSRFGNDVVAGFGAAGKIEMLIMIIPNSLASVMAPFSGQNWGAGKIGRIRRGLRFSGAVSLAWGVMLFAAFMIFGSRIMGLFSESAAVVDAGARYLRIMAVGYGFFGLLNISTQSLNALNKPLHSAAITLAKTFLINVSLAVLGAAIWNQTGVFGASLVANILGGAMGFAILTAVLKKAESRTRADADYTLRPA